MNQVGYCTNVHAGPDLQQTRENLQKHAERVRDIHCPETTMGVGLWLAAPAARSLRESPAELKQFAAYLEAAALVPFTLNGFPYGDFHQPVVKHAVYSPTWMDAPRVDYTRDLFHVLHELLPPDMEGTISTLPVAWGSFRQNDAALQQAGRHLRQIAKELAQLHSDTGRCISVCIEPEPGCVMDRAEHIVDFFEQHLLRDGEEEIVRRHLRVCHDVCHSAVMFEPQDEALRKYQTAGIRVGKVQVSSAVALPFDELDPQQRQEALKQLAEFNEPRYLHQTMHRDRNGALNFYEDLAPALAALSEAPALEGEVRVHFHVPIYLQQFGQLHTTQADVLQCLQHVETEHFEVETYAWGVLPEELQQPTLAEGIAEEMNWFRQQL